MGLPFEEHHALVHEGEAIGPWLWLQDIGDLEPGAGRDRASSEFDGSRDGSESCNQDKRYGCAVPRLIIQTQRLPERLLPEGSTLEAVAAGSISVPHRRRCLIGRDPRH